ncbi:MAG: hypothetical protein U0234_02730 [Sandaracinus sp.]
MSRNLLAFSGPLAVWLVLAPGCSAVVGSECRAPLSVCGRFCVDLQSDELHCGMCNAPCRSGTSCVGGVCAGDAGPADAGRTDASTVDAGRDAGRDAAAFDGGEDAGLDAARPRDAGASDAGPLCHLGELLCAGTCVSPRAPAHCGDCATACSAGEVCSDTGCAPDCGAQTDCGGSCADLTSDAHHCGDCAMDCGSAACVAGTCQPDAEGDVVVIGHDFDHYRAETRTLLVNGVFLPAHDPLRVVVWDRAATATTRANVTMALSLGAGARAFTRVTATSAESIPVLLDDADTFLVLGQPTATDAELTALGSAWRLALEELLRRGGAVVLLDSPSLGNGGTFQIVRSAGLFQATAISEVVSAHVSLVTARASDPLLVGIPAGGYTGDQHTVVFSSLSPDAVLRAPSGPVAFHVVVAP